MSGNPGFVAGTECVGKFNFLGSAAHVSLYSTQAPYISYCRYTCTCTYVYVGPYTESLVCVLVSLACRHGIALHVVMGFN